MSKIFADFIKKYLGRECLLRAVCETSATPLHSDGLLGDAINFLLSGSYEATTSHDREYSEAQAQGQVSRGDVDISDNKISISSHLSITALGRLFSLSQYLSCVSLQIFIELCLIVQI